MERTGQMELDEQLEDSTGSAATTNLGGGKVKPQSFK